VSLSNILAPIRRKFLYLPIDIRRRLVKTLVFPVLDNRTVLFSDMLVVTSMKVQRARNACMRLVTGVRKFDPITPCNNLEVLKVEDRRKFAVTLFTWKIHKFNVPNYLYNQYVLMSTVHSRCNRFTNASLYIPRYRTEKYGDSFLINSCRLWNDLLLHPICITTLT